MRFPHDSNVIQNSRTSIEARLRHLGGDYESTSKQVRASSKNLVRTNTSIAKIVSLALTKA
jgi:hypothetical protein